MGEVKVLGAWASPFVMRPTIALNIKSVPYEFLEETFGSKSELLLKSNPVYKKIPVLIHNDRPISESMIIVQYIDETWTDGPSILPSDPYDRAIARFWATYIDDKVFHYFLLTHYFLLPLVLSIALLGVYKGRNMGGGVGGRKKKKKKVKCREMDGKKRGRDETTKHESRIHAYACTETRCMRYGALIQ
ncbi:hypothetical protein ACLOJK_028586 [Asimina triloba]